MSSFYDIFEPIGQVRKPLQPFTLGWFRETMLAQMREDFEADPTGQPFDFPLHIPYTFMNIYRELAPNDRLDLFKNEGLALLGTIDPLGGSTIEEQMESALYQYLRDQVLPIVTAWEVEVPERRYGECGREATYGDGCELHGDDEDDHDFERASGAY